MQDEQKQIEGMAKDIYATGVAIDGTDIAYGVHDNDDHFHRMAIKLYKIGYRKQSDTAREILDEVSRHFGGAWLVELYKKYGVEVEE